MYTHGKREVQGQTASKCKYIKIPTNGLFITLLQNIPHLPLWMFSTQRDQCSYKTYKCEFSSYSHAGHINQQYILPTRSHPYSCRLIARGAGGDKAGSICTAGKNTVSTTVWQKSKEQRGQASERKTSAKLSLKIFINRILMRRDKERLLIPCYAAGNVI